mmetsp:Transcript_766/g.1840  ORF Transcript_766/g.1840 Transcript_766/m.1840 type:complete len:242 (+) Transcript_766:121-846(+)|eukprot:CAMPEP_0119559960 /NCGR_PEP_ID=MMETSP1352-20130426/13655_1 /TAXON_ID=265584 /ORGANISM="Stauroneis constricta, Strain CCMP1120" /LENGTH=241 /DNA_ID=CAMNT_0007607799 /DNA_START=87 /DNA_END=812 /DNA_ORIENTATION=+
MPPNRKQHVNFADGVDILKGSQAIQSKFLPLTARPPTSGDGQPFSALASGKAAVATTTERDGFVYAAHARDPKHAVHEYWDWAAESQSDEGKRARILDSILEMERIRQILSTKHTEEHLIRTHFAPAPSGADDVDASEEAVAADTSLPQNDDYWSWPSASDPPARRMSPADAYWFVPPTQPTAAHVKGRQLLDRILEQERCRQVVSADHIVDQLKAESASGAPQQESSNGSNKDGDDYWSW